MTKIQALFIFFQVLFKHNASMFWYVYVAHCSIKLIIFSRPDYGTIQT